MIKRKARTLLTVFLGVASVAVIGLVLAAVMQSPSKAEDVPDGPTVTVYKDPSCRCCTYWAQHLEQAGFDVDIRPASERDEMHEMYGISKELAACHTGVVDGYVIEGHVSAADIRRLLEERPDVAGLTDRARHARRVAGHATAQPQTFRSPAADKRRYDRGVSALRAEGVTAAQAVTRYGMFPHAC